MLYVGSKSRFQILIAKTSIQPSSSDLSTVLKVSQGSLYSRSCPMLMIVRNISKTAVNTEGDPILKGILVELCVVVGGFKAISRQPLNSLAAFRAVIMGLNLSTFHTAQDLIPKKLKSSSTELI